MTNMNHAGLEEEEEEEEEETETEEEDEEVHASPDLGLWDPQGMVEPWHGTHNQSTGCTSGDHSLIIDQALTFDQQLIINPSQAHYPWTINSPSIHQITLT